MKKIAKNISGLPIIIFLVLAKIAKAQEGTRIISEDLSNKINGQATAYTAAAGFTRGMSMGEMAALIIQILLSVIGVLFVVLMVYGGYTWMMAKGNEEEVRKAQNIIKQAVWGLVITIAAYSIAYFLLEWLSVGGGLAAD